MANKKFMWDTNMLKRFYEKYVVNWLHRDMNWTEEQKANGRANLGLDEQISAFTDSIQELYDGVVVVSGDGTNSIVQKDTGCSASGDCAVSFGNNNSANGDNSFSEGSDCKSNATNTHAGGNQSIAGADNSFAYGNGVTTSNNSEAAFGKYNSTRSSLIFDIGAGNDNNNRKNIFEIEQLGDIYITYNNQLKSLQGIILSLVNSIESLGGTVTF